MEPQQQIPLGPPVNEQNSTAVQPSLPPSPTPPIVGAPNPAQNKRQSRKKVWILALIVFVLIIACVFGYYYLNHSSHQNKNTVSKLDSSSTNTTSASAKWSIVSTPNTDSNSYDNELSSVSCASISDCWAVGDFTSQDQSETGNALIQHWDGSSWENYNAGDITNVSSQNGNILSSVNCVSTSDCWAVGSVDNQNALVVHWSGSKWSSVNPNIQSSGSSSSDLNSVYCVNASDCWAVGDLNDQSSNVQYGLLETWNGKAWTGVQTTEFKSLTLSKVICLDSSDCWAVGYEPNTTVWGAPNAADLPKILSWNGKSWTVVQNPNDNEPNSNVNSISCASSSLCFAVGNTHKTSSETLIDTWNGSSWSDVRNSVSSSESNDELFDVSCIGSNDCWAVGINESDPKASTPPFVALNWDGKEWSSNNLSTPPSYTGVDEQEVQSGPSELSSISCIGNDFCMTVGDSINKSDNSVNIAELYH